MNTFAALLIVSVAITGCLADPEEGFRKTLKAAIDKCNSDPATTVDRDAVKAFRVDNGPKPANLGAHELCVSKELNLQNADGTVNSAFIKEKLAEHAASTHGKSVDEILAACAVQKENEVATAEHLLKCLIFDHARNPHPKTTV